MSKILIVDNALKIREEVCGILVREGYQVFQAENGTIGFKMALKECPDLIISEVQLPIQNDLEMFEALQKEQKTTNIPLLILSEKSEKEDVRNGMDAGAADYLAKPFNSKNLIKVTKRILKKQKAIKDNLVRLIEEKNFSLKKNRLVSKIGYWDHDIQTDIRNWSNGVHTIFGTNPKQEKLFYEVALNCFTEASRKSLIEATTNLTENGVLYDLEFQITNLKNEKRWVQSIGEPIYSSKNKIIGSKGIIIDITQFKNNQQALKRSNERFEMAAKATNDAIWDWNLLTGKIYRNTTGYYKVFGEDDARLKDDICRPDEFIHPDDKHQINLLLKEIVESVDQNNFVLEYRFLHYNGTYIHIKDKGFIIRDKTGKAIRIVGATSNITKRKEAEKSLEESFSNIEAILESTADGILVVDNFDTIVRFNKRFLELWNMPKEVLTSLNDNVALDYILNQLINPIEFTNKVKEIYSKKEATSSDIIELKDGRVFERYSQPKVINGSITGRVWSFRNITDRVTAEKEKQQLFALIETSNDIIGFGDMNGNPTFFNKAGKKQLGIDIKRPISSYHHSDFFDATQHGLDEKISKGIANKGRWEGDTYLTNLITKKKIPVHMSAFVIKDSSTGKPIGLGNVSRDITVIEKINKELIQASKKAEKLSGFKDQFLANMSHEIRTPLGIIIGFTKILLRNAVSEKQKDQLTAIKTSGDTLLVVINDILDLAKIEAGMMTLEKTELKVPELINTVLSTFELRLEEKKQTLKTNYDTYIPKWLLGDPVRINQILYNLIDNAIKFTPSEGVIDVNVNLLNQDEEKAVIEIVVSDSGIGIPKGKINTVFNAYSQSDKTTTREYGGSGLGLNIVKQLIDLMKGTILVKSRLGIGSIFTVTIPLLKTTKTDVVPQKYISKDGELKKIKILIVDDMLMNQFLAKTIVQHLGFTSDTADNGKIAISLLKKNNYDLILMDLQMPIMNGWNTTKFIRTKMPPQKSAIPIIALTARITKEDLDKCKKVGMDECVTKPINETELFNKIHKLVKKKHNSVPVKRATKVCNLDYLKTHLNHNPEYITEMIQIILKETPDVFKEIDTCLATSNWKDLCRNMHKILPTINLISPPKNITQCAIEIEEYARNQEYLDVIPAKLVTLEKALGLAYKELEEELILMKN
jgi:PAS domain S-box-containing protein